MKIKEIELSKEELRMLLVFLFLIALVIAGNFLPEAFSGLWAKK